MDTPGLQIDATVRAQVVDAVLQKLDEHYIFPDVAAAMGEAIRRCASNGEYDTITDGKVLATTLQAHLREVSHDKHLRVFFSPEPRPLRDSFEHTPEEREEYRLWGVAHNFGFEKVERLAGNVGYLDLRMFFAVEIPGAAETAVAAMNLLAHTSALIVDLRRNGGGDPHMVQLITSYLFDGPVHLNSMYWRASDETHQFWTLPYVPGKRDGDKPVYVLTSGDTFSGGEEFT